ncbi:hypothetical protein D3C72_1634580 [compost metagenome]
MQVLSKEQGVFELTLLNAELSRDQFDDFVVMGVSRGIPVEIMTRLQGMWNLTKEIAGEVVAIGKIVVRKIFEFLKANPNLSIGIALGAAVGALISGIPFIGPLLAPLSAGLSMLYGAAVGSTLDQGVQSNDPFVAATLLARKFFELIQSIFLSIKEYFAAP